MTNDALVKLFDTIGPRFGDREGGYLRIVRTGWNKGDGADKAFLELLGSEKVLDEKREKRAESRAKRAAEAKKAMEEAEAQAQSQGEAAPAEGDEKKEKPPPDFTNPGLVPCLSCSLTTAGRLLQSLLSKRAADSAHESCLAVEPSQAK